MPPDHRSGEFGGFRRVSDRLHAGSPYPQDLNKAIGGELAIRARDI